MNKILTTLLIYCLTITSVMAGLPPTTLSGDQQTTKPTTFNFKVPNQLATQVTGGTREESGNTNLLANPSFEHSTFNTGWTTSLGTASLTTNALNAGSVTEGLQAFKVTSSGAGVRVAQVSTINAAGLKGQQMVARAKVYSSDSALQMCALVDNISTGDTNCITVPVTDTNTPFKSIEIPFVAGGTSNGIVIKSATTTAQTIYIDDVSVGTASPFQNVQGATLLGKTLFSSCTWGKTGSGTFAVTTGCVYTNSGSATTPGTMIPGSVYPTLAAGNYVVVFTGILENSPGNNDSRGTIAITDGTNTSAVSSMGMNTAVAASSIGRNSGSYIAEFTYSTTQSNITFQPTVAGSTTTLATGASISVYYYPPSSRIYSQASQDTAYQTCTFASNAWQGFGTVTPNLLCSRKGDTLKMKGKWTSGTVAAALGQIPLPNNWGTINIASTTQSNQIVGLGFRNAAAAGAYALLTSPSTSYISVSSTTVSSANNPVIPVNGNVPVASAEVQDFDGEIAIQIQGWQDYNVIVGSFSGIEKAANDYESTDRFTATVSSTCVVSNQSVPWIASTVNNSTGVCTLTYQTYLKDGVNPLTSPMNCTATPQTNARALNIPTSSSTTLVTNIVNSTTNAAVADSYFISCEKASPDFKPKTGKMASSIGVPTVPGITTTGTGNTIDTFSVSYGATISTACASANGVACPYVDAIGTNINVTHGAAAGTYNLVAPKTYAKLKCVMNAGILGLMSYNLFSCSSCNTLSFTTGQSTNGTDTNSYGTLMCQGTY